MERTVLTIAMVGLLACGTAAQADVPQNQLTQPAVPESRMEVYPEPETPVQPRILQECNVRSWLPECRTTEDDINRLRFQFALAVIDAQANEIDRWRRRFYRERRLRRTLEKAR